MKRILGLFLAATTLASVAAGDVMWQPTVATTNMGNFGGIFAPSQLISQVGLTTGYVSGITNAGTYNSTHNNIFDEWQSAIGNPSGVVTFDLGAAVNVKGFRLWNSSWTTGGAIDVRDFVLLSDTDNDSTNGVSGSMGAFSALNTGGGPHAMQSFSFTATTTQFVHMRIASNHGSLSASGFSEAAFVVSSVPEPTSLFILGTLVGCLGLARRNRAR